MLGKMTLKWVNTQRAERNLPPLKKLPKGKRGNTTECVIANGFRDSDGYTSILGGYDCIAGKPVEMPLYAQIYAHAFDVGLHPFKVGQPELVYAADSLSIKEKYQQRKAVREAERQIAEEQRLAAIKAAQERQAALERERLAAEKARQAKAKAMIARVMAEENMSQALALAADMGTIGNCPEDDNEYKLVVIPSMPREYVPMHN